MAERMQEQGSVSGGQLSSGSRAGQVPGLRRAPARRLRAAVRGLSPGYFALVMATGIVSVAVGADGAATLSTLLLVLGSACYVVLTVAHGWRLASYRREFAADATGPPTAFLFFTFVAGTSVLAARLAGDGHHILTMALLALAGLAWLVLTYGTPLALVTRHGTASALAGVNGSWFLWTVGTQSLAVSLASLPPPVSGRAAALATALWAVGVMLYLLVAGLALAGLLHFSVDPGRLSPNYWVFMGASAISVLAGARVLTLPAGPLAAAVRPVVAGLSVVLWAFGTWLIPFLAGLGIWRHLVRRVPLRYEPALWGMVFPLGMYCVASGALGSALKVAWLVRVGRAGTWVAFAAWAVVFAAMLASWAGLPRTGAVSQPAEPRGTGRQAR